MDEPHLLAAVRYVELNPVRAKLTDDAASWPWSSARAHLSGRDDCLIEVGPMLAMVHDWQGLLDSAFPEEELRKMRGHSRTGRPLGSDAFVSRLEQLVGRVVGPRKRGRKPKFPRLP